MHAEAEALGRAWAELGAPLNAELGLGLGDLDAAGSTAFRAGVRDRRMYGAMPPA